MFLGLSLRGSDALRGVRRGLPSYFCVLAAQLRLRLGADEEATVRVMTDSESRDLDAFWWLAAQSYAAVLA